MSKVDNKVMMVEVEMLFHGEGSFLFREPNVELIRAVRNACRAGMRVIASATGSSTPNKTIISMLEQYGIQPEHLAITTVAESKLKLALHNRYKPALVFEDNPELVAKFAEQGSWVMNPQAMAARTGCIADAHNVL